MKKKILRKSIMYDKRIAINWYSENSTEEEYARRSQKEHQQIYAALEKRDAALAGKGMKKHIYRSMEDVLTRYQWLWILHKNKFGSLNIFNRLQRW